jgi:hypothetical protein
VGQAVAYWLRQYAISWKVRVSGPNEVNEFFKILLILPVMLGPGVHSTYNRNEYQKQKIMFLENRVQPVHRADNLTAFCEPNVCTCGILKISQPYRPLRPVKV